MKLPWYCFGSPLSECLPFLISILVGLTLQSQNASAALSVLQWTPLVHSLDDRLEKGKWRSKAFADRLTSLYIHVYIFILYYVV